MANQAGERIPPHNQEAEICVLGAVLINSEVLMDVSETLRPEDFYSEAHREIYNAILELNMESKAVDLITVCECLSKRHSLEAVGGRGYVVSLSDAVPTSANAKEYAEIVREKAVLRGLIQSASNIVGSCYEEQKEPARILDEAEASILSISQGRHSGSSVALQDILGRNLETILENKARGGVTPGLPSGFKTLDDKTTGFAPSDFIIVAARPSMGKTAFALNIMQNAAIKSHARVVFYSLEMSEEQLGMRMLSMEARVDSKKLRVGDVSSDDLEDINHAIERLSKMDIIIDATPGMSVMEIRNKTRRLAAKKPLDLIVIDYLQLMTTGGPAESRQQEVSTISRYLKQLAREMKCPVICLSQLSRAVEQRQGSKRPILSDLRESGAIEQDADIVMFLYREDYYKEKDEEPSNTAEVIIAKNRNGETGVVTLTWIPRFTKFADMAGPLEKARVPQNSTPSNASLPPISMPEPKPEEIEEAIPMELPPEEEYVPESIEISEEINLADLPDIQADDDIDF